jgi:hypothetical protein
MPLLTLVATIATALAACGGKEGPQGPAGAPGPAGVSNRNAIYCRSVGDATLATGYALTVACDANTHLPLEGSCSSGTLPANYRLARDEPVGWNNQGAAPASWACSWRPGTGDTLVDTIAGTSAWICCVPP